MTTAKRPKRRTTSTRVTTECLYPDECAPHTFTYVKRTKPQVYCEPHRKGYTETDPFTKEVHWHGGEKRVRVTRGFDGSVIARRLVTEKVRTDAEVNRELRRVEQALPPLMRWFEPLYHWREVTNDPDIPDFVTTSALVTGRNGKPRWDPTLWRTLQTEEREVGIEATLSLDASMGEDEDGAPVTLLDVTDAEQVSIQTALDPVTAILPDATPLQVAIGRVQLGIARATHYRMFKAARRRDPMLAATAEREVRLALAEARMRQAALAEPVGGVSPVQDIEGGIRRHEQKDRS